MSKNEWKVTYHGNFWGAQGESGREILLNLDFFWGKEHWLLPAIYLCEEGMVLDFCQEAEPEELNAFIDKWDLLNERSNYYTEEEREQIEAEHPLMPQFRPELTVNGRELQWKYSSMCSWVPESCLKGEVYRDEKGFDVLKHYGLNPEKGWSIHRYSLPWNGPAMEPKSMELRMMRDKRSVFGEAFSLPQVGKTQTIRHPVSGEEYKLTVLQIDRGELPVVEPMDDVEMPTHYLAMAYHLEPEILQDFNLKDCRPSDRPRSKSGQRVRNAPMGMVVARTKMDEDGKRIFSAASSLRFEAVESVEWKPIFRVKTMEDLCLNIELPE